ncbi:MAG TPA: response regulator transcription factor [Vicinamibacterales bacterium]
MADRILIVEHDARLRHSLCERLGLEGYAPDPVPDTASALSLCATRQFDLIIQNLHAPTVGGLALCRRLRHALNRHTPILLLTNDAGIRDAQTALEQCADDYLVTPFGLREFVARVRALLRRSRVGAGHAASLTSPPAVVRDRLVIDPARRRVNVEGRDVKLTVHEFQLLYTLAARAGVVFDREALLSEVWGQQTFVTIRSVDALVKRVRRQLDAAEPQLDYVVTVRGVGYKFDDAQTSA